MAKKKKYSEGQKAKSKKTGKTFIYDEGAGKFLPEEEYNSLTRTAARTQRAAAKMDAETKPKRPAESSPGAAKEQKEAVAKAKPTPTPSEKPLWKTDAAGNRYKLIDGRYVLQTK